ncbi:MAG: D-alanyl-D-alanine carboxypeptidase family protein [Acutalibacteraceae bacterium]|nr:D-alanyl-D-alanine carboxypeptidase family protein [Acutalibacteraceae bacterium]
MLKYWITIFVVVFLFVIFMSCFTVSAKADTATIGVSAQSAVLYCVNNDTVLFEKNSNEKMSMASTTKILTTLIALEHSQAEDKEVTFTKEMIAEGSSMYLKEGYKLHLSDLATGMMTVSGNDAANAVAISISGSIEEFAKVMNTKAQQIGMTSSSFVTPSGLDDENHYSTALDMARLMAYAMSNNSFAELTAKKNARVDFISPEDMSITYGNHNRLLSLYEYCNGGKTGFTKKSGRCLVTSAEKDGVKLIAVTLNAPDDWNDHINMYNYGFSKVTAVTDVDKDYTINTDVVGGTKNSVTVKPVKAIDYVKPADSNSEVTRKVIIDSFLYAPIEKGEVVGTAQYYFDNKLLCEVPLVTTTNVEYKTVEKGFFESIAELFKNIF